MPSSFDKFSKYEPVDDSLSSKDFQRSYWLVTHKVLLRNLGIAVLLVADTLLLVYALSGFAQYLISGQPREEAMILEIANRLNSSSIERQKLAAAAPLDFGDGRVFVFDAGNERYDFAVEVQNPNRDWYAMVTYKFNIAGADATASRTTYILPGEKKFLTVLGESRVGGIGSDAAFEVVNIMWSRIDRHVVPDAVQFVADHASFLIQDPIFTQLSAAADEATENSGNKISFTITNTSAYNFWSIPVQIIFMRAGSVEGIEETQIRELKTGETRTIDVRNYVKNLLVDDVVVIPSPDVFDASVYMEQ